MRVEGTAQVAPGSSRGVALSAGGGAPKFLIETPIIERGEGGVVPVEDYQVALAQDSGSAAPNDQGTVNLINNPQVIYSSLLAGSGTAGPKTGGSPPVGRDFGLGITVDAQGLVYITGQTESIDFPVTSNAFQGADNGAGRGLPNVFVTVLDPSKPPDSQLIYSTYLGGSGEDCAGKACTSERGDRGFAIALGPNGLIYLAGQTFSSDFPVTSSAFQSVNRAFGTTANPANLWGPSNAFFAVIDRSATPAQQLVYSTYLGGTGGEQGFGVAVDTTGLAYVGGMTASTDFPVTPSAFQNANRGFQGVPLSGASSSGFVSILDPTKKGKSSLKYSSYLGGSFAKRMGAGDAVISVALDPSGLVYLTGNATSTSFPV
ncbi:MAG: SBBP repeat-containing protein, partial [Alphaproteobacteria bacterium]